MGQLSKFASYAKCNVEEVNIKGNEVCEESKRYLVEKNDIYYFFSPEWKLQNRD